MGVTAMTPTSIFGLIALVSTFVSASSAVVPRGPTKCTLTTNASKTRCGIAGRVLTTQEPYYSGGQPQIVSTVEECALLCFRRITSQAQQQEPRSFDHSYYNGYYCQSFYYDIKEKICQLGLLSTNTAVKANPASSKVFYDNDCFACGAFCNQPYGSQLLDNGGFEGKLLGPWITTGAHVVKRQDSGHAYACDFNFTGPISLQQNLNMCQGELYRVEFEYLARSPRPNAHYKFVCSMPDSTLQLSSAGNASNPASWRTALGYVKITGVHPGPSFVFYGEQGPRQVLIDNVKVSRVPAPSVKKGAMSLFANGGFETGKLAPAWRVVEGKLTTDEPFTVTTPGLGGSAYGVTVARNYEDSKYLVQDIATKPGTTYLFSVEAQSANGVADVVFDFGPPNSRTTHEVLFDEGVGSFSVPVLATTNSLLFRMHVYGYRSDPGNKTFDNFSLLELKPGGFY